MTDEDRPAELIAIDPGDVYTGVAFFATDEDGAWYCQGAAEMGREEFEDALAELLMLEPPSERPKIVVFEKWRLYADHAKEKTGSEFETSQLIGVIRYLVRVQNEHVERHDRAEAEGKMMTCELRGGMCEDPVRRPHRIQLVKQPADIKKPTTGILRKKKVKSVAKPISKAEYGGRDHVVDAELHGWHHILNTLNGAISEGA